MASQLHERPWLQDKQAEQQAAPQAAAAAQNSPAKQQPQRPGDGNLLSLDSASLVHAELAARKSTSVSSAHSTPVTSLPPGKAEVPPAEQPHTVSASSQPRAFKDDLLSTLVALFCTRVTAMNVQHTPHHATLTRPPSQGAAGSAPGSRCSTKESFNLLITCSCVRADATTLQISHVYISVFSLKPANCFAQAMVEDALAQALDLPYSVFASGPYTPPCQAERVAYSASLGLDGSPPEDPQV